MLIAQLLFSGYRVASLADALSRSEDADANGRSAQGSRSADAAALLRYASWQRRDRKHRQAPCVFPHFPRLTRVAKTNGRPSSPRVLFEFCCKSSLCDIGRPHLVPVHEGEQVAVS